MNNLIVIRHADAAHQGISDFERPLTSLGEKQASEQGLWLQGQLPRPEMMLVSGALRTRQTAAAINLALNLPVEFDDAIYEATAGELLVRLEPWLDRQCLIMVGHNPGVSALVSYLVGDYVGIAPADIAVLKFSDDVSGSPQPGTAVLETLHQHRSA